jgi:hypothetical protein
MFQSISPLAKNCCYVVLLMQKPMAYNNLLCQELLGYNIADPEDMKILLAQNTFMNFCTGAIAYTIEILKAILAEK